jgi:phospholipid/cholesterol/gamma-HCH transport system substrate-binding protein
MQVNEEIDALSTLGFSPIELLVLPRILALVLMTPLLCLYANLMGILGGALTSIDEELARNRDDIRKIVADVAATAEAIKGQTPAVGKILANTQDASGEVRRAAATLEQILQSNSDAIGALIDEWTITAGAVRRLADQVNMAIAENRPGLRDFTQTGLYEYTGLAQDAQRLVDQITRVADELERDPARFFFGDRTQGVAPE